MLYFLPEVNDASQPHLSDDPRISSGRWHSASLLGSRGGRLRLLLHSQHVRMIGRLWDARWYLFPLVAIQVIFWKLHVWAVHLHHTLSPR